MTSMSTKIATATEGDWDTSHTLLRICGALLAGTIASIHMVEGPGTLDKSVYLAVLFYVGAAFLYFAMLALVAHRDTFAWLVAGGISLLMFVGGILSRTIGLPGFHESTWPPLLLTALTLEALVMVLWGVRTVVDRRR